MSSQARGADYYRDDVRKWVEQKITSFQTKATRHKWLAIGARSLTILLSVATAFALGYDWETTLSQTAVKNVALSLSSLSAIIGGADAAFGWKSHWLQNQETANAMRELRDDLDIELHCNEVNLQKLERIYRRYKVILRSTNKRWGSMVDNEDSSAKSVKGDS